MRKVVLCGIPHHSNLGDHAIYIAEKNIIRKKFKGDNWCLVIDVMGKRLKI